MQGRLTTSLLVWDQYEPIDQYNNMWEYYNGRIEDVENGTIAGGEEIIIPVSESHVKKLSCQGVGNGGA